MHRRNCFLKLSPPSERSGVCSCGCMLTLQAEGPRVWQDSAAIPDALGILSRAVRSGKWLVSELLGSGMCFHLDRHIMNLLLA